MAPLSVCYSHTYWLWACCGVKRALVATFCLDVSLFKQRMNRFLKETLKCWALKFLKTQSQTLLMLKEFLFNLTIQADSPNCNLKLARSHFFPCTFGKHINSVGGVKWVQNPTNNFKDCNLQIIKFHLFIQYFSFLVSVNSKYCAPLCILQTVQF